MVRLVNKSTAAVRVGLLAQSQNQYGEKIWTLQNAEMEPNCTVV